MTASREKAEAEEAANGRFNGNLSDPGATALSLPPDRGPITPAAPTLARPNAVLA